MANVTEADFRANLHEMFKALDLDQNDSLSWKECKGMVAQVMKSKGGYDAESFKESYDKMDKNDDGNISKAEFIERIVEIGKENNLFGLALLRKQTVTRPQYEDLGSDVEEGDQEIDQSLCKKGLSCLGKTFNNARHAYLKMDISKNSLTTIKVSFSNLTYISYIDCLFSIFVRVLDVSSSFSSLMYQIIS